MIHSDYYQKYKGPNLTKAILNDDQDITELIKKFYGDKNDWCGKLWTYQDVFGYNCKGSKFYCEFHSEDQRKHWFHGFINNEKNNFNIPLHTPMNQGNDKKL